ncbi:MAG: sensor histidine kinase [Vicinamibacterales bacterium]
MTAVKGSSFAAGFAAALSNYLDVQDEAALSQAYDLGRRAINEGLGLLDITLMYQDALGSMPNDRREPRHFMRAAEFLFETLAPFEMTYRGYKDANEQLQQLTHRLEQQNRHLTKATLAAEAANKELEAFSHSVSHDLRAPVRHIAAFSRLLAEEHAKDLQPAALRYLTTIQQAAHNMAQMIDDLLNLSRIERQELVSRAVDLNAVVAEVIHELEHDLAGRTIAWNVASLPTVNGDRGLIKLVFTNLLSNAVKYTRNRQTAEIQVGQAVGDDATVLFVKDNGAGFDPRYADKLFGVFQRLHRAEEFEGTGVGLATVERIIKKHSGRIWAEAAVDSGATFYFSLGPTREPPQASLS